MSVLNTIIEIIKQVFKPRVAVTPVQTQTAKFVVTASLAKGSHGTQVKILQAWLNKYGFRDDRNKSLVEDGIFGDFTKQAVKHFQKTVGIVVDGEFGPISQAAAKKYEDSKNNPTPKPAVVPTPAPTPSPTPVPQTGIYQSQRFIHNLKQATDYYCCDFMEEEILNELYNATVPQSQLAKLCGTGTAGTGHAGAIQGIKSEAVLLGHAVTAIFQNFSDTGWTKLGQMVAAENIGAGIHCLYRNKWGHYMYPCYINLNTKVVGFVDSLNKEDILYVSFAEAESWMKNNYLGQPSVFVVTKVK